MSINGKSTVGTKARVDVISHWGVGIKVSMNVMMKSLMASQGVPGYRLDTNFGA